MKDTVQLGVLVRARARMTGMPRDVHAVGRTVQVDRVHHHVDADSPVVGAMIVAVVPLVGTAPPLIGPTATMTT